MTMVKEAGVGPGPVPGDGTGPDAVTVHLL